MFKPNTVFVLGAAASLDFDFPLGEKFKTDISNFLRLSKDGGFGGLQATQTNTRFFSGFQDATNTFEAAQKISNGLGFAPSIDHFLEMRKTDRDIVSVGKAAIAHLIFEREKAASKLRTPNPYQPLPSATRFDKTWHQKFAEICFTNCLEEELPEALSRVAFISFNYDRCIEQFVRLAMSALYSLEFTTACAIADEHLTVLYPYGSLGKLSELSFPVNNDYRSATSLAGKIKTFTEQVDDKTPQSALRQKLTAAETVIFLGFGYHTQNVDLLQCDTNLVRKQVIGTAKGLSTQAREVTRRNILDATAPKKGGRNYENDFKGTPVD